MRTMLGPLDIILKKQKNVFSGSFAQVKELYASKKKHTDEAVLRSLAEIANAKVPTGEGNKKSISLLEAFAKIRARAPDQPEADQPETDQTQIVPFWNKLRTSDG